MGNGFSHTHSFEPVVLDEVIAGPIERVERIVLATQSIAGEQQQPGSSLTCGELLDEQLDVSCHQRVAAKRKLGVDRALDGMTARLVQTDACDVGKISRTDVSE